MSNGPSTFFGHDLAPGQAHSYGADRVGTTREAQCVGLQSPTQQAAIHVGSECHACDVLGFISFSPTYGRYLSRTDPEVRIEHLQNQGPGCIGRNACRYPLAAVRTHRGQHRPRLARAPRQHLRRAEVCTLQSDDVARSRRQRVIEHHRRGRAGCALLSAGP